MCCTLRAVPKEGLPSVFQTCLCRVAKGNDGSRRMSVSVPLRPPITASYLQQFTKEQESWLRLLHSELNQAEAA